MNLNSKVASLIAVMSAVSAFALEIESPKPLDYDFFLSSIRRQYSNDVLTVSGRARWHGKLVSQEIDDTNRFVKIERYADGTAFLIKLGKRQSDYASIFSNKTARAASAKRTSNHPVKAFRQAADLAQANKSVVSNITVNVEIGK